MFRNSFVFQSFCHIKRYCCVFQFFQWWPIVCHYYTVFIIQLVGEQFGMWIWEYSGALFSCRTSVLNWAVSFHFLFSVFWIFFLYFLLIFFCILLFCFSFWLGASLSIPADISFGLSSFYLRESWHSAPNVALLATLLAPRLPLDDNHSYLALPHLSIIYYAF